jgi:hypothetical protein
MVVLTFNKNINIGKSKVCLAREQKTGIEIKDKLAKGTRTEKGNGGR